MGDLSLLCLFIFLVPGFLSQSADEWIEQAEEALQKALHLQTLNTNEAKNVLMFIGDGMGIATVTSARILKGQLQGNTGEETVLNMESLPHVALSKTYNTDSQVGDSAGTATAFLCGVKTKVGVLGVHNGAIKGDCHSSLNASVDSVLKLALDAGKSVGVVTTTRITHATPAAAYAHTPNREWESNNKIPIEERLHGCRDIALQLVEDGGRDFQVLLGGGRRDFLRITQRDPEHDMKFGSRTDGLDLIEEWKKNRPYSSKSSYVWNKKDFDKVNPETTDYLLGLFEHDHMQYDANREEDIAGEPSLSEMVEKAIKMLKKNKNGFFLLVEGGRIDHSHHLNIAYHALKDTLAFDDALATAMSLTNSIDTLTIVTADHSHVNTIAGYPSRGNPILGINDKKKGLDDLPYTTIMYTNGPGAKAVIASLNETGQRPNVTGVDTEAKTYVQQALVPKKDETHGGEDVTIYADGPMAHLFHGVHEQHYIAHVIKYASCLGNSTEHCNKVHLDTRSSYSDSSGAETAKCLKYFILFMTISFHQLYT
ncbi:alkaline phosphatase-like [Ptychodera flava]|uniref:alkaline phosphatase-like n=1 Tax=Ptychodera flava TaxID=63121 RepID=UPI00396A492D